MDLDDIDLQLPTTEEELALFVLAGRRFFTDIGESNFLRDYALTMLHISRYPLLLVRSVKVYSHNELDMVMRGTDELISLSWYYVEERGLIQILAERASEFDEYKGLFDES